jgi:serine/threonine protein kinase
MSDLELDNKGFIDDLHIEIIESISNLSNDEETDDPNNDIDSSNLSNDEDEETDDPNDEIDFSSLDFSNTNFKLITQGETYEDFDVIYVDNEQYGVKILRCKSHNVIIKLFLWDFNDDNDYDPCIVNEVGFYNDNNDKLGNEVIKMINKPFYNILWYNKSEGEIILGYIMEDGHSRYKIYKLIQYDYEKNFKNIRITSLENIGWNDFVVDSKKLINNFITLKKNNISHFDIKPENITKELKFMDFGCYMNVHDFYNYIVQLYNGNVNCLSMGTIGYQAPELVLTKLFYPTLPSLEYLSEIMYKIDLFSLGCTLISMICNMSFYEDIIYMQCMCENTTMFELMFMTPYERPEKIKKYYYKYFDESGYFKSLIRQLKERIKSRELLDLIEAMVSLNPHERPDLDVLENYLII